MKVLLICVSLTCGSLALRADTICQWNFNSAPPDADTSTGTLTPSIGAGTCVFVGSVTHVFFGGDMAISHDPAGTTDNSAVSTASYPAVTGANKSAGVRFNVNTTGYTNIFVAWYQQNSPSGSRFWRVQYTVDGAAFLDANSYALYKDGVFTNKAADLSSIAGAANNPNFGVRMVSEYEFSATGSGTNAFVATKDTSNYGTGGTARFDMMTISGTLLPGANSPPTITGVGDQTIRVTQSTGPLPFTVLDAEDPATSLVLAKASSDTNVVPLANIVFGGSGQNRTVNVTGAQIGVSTITISVIDTGGKSNSMSFAVNVLAQNTAPTISAISPTNCLINSSAGPIDFTINDAETPATSLTLSVVSSNTTLLPLGGIAIGGSGGARTIQLTPAAGQSGIAPVTLTVSDGTNSTMTSFALMVLPSASLLLFDPFNYPDGSVVTNSAVLWDNRSGIPGDCRISGNQLVVSGTNFEDVMALLAGAPIARSNSTVLYSSFKADFLSLPKTTPDYFAHFAQSSSSLRGKIFAGLSTNAPAGSFRLFVANSASTAGPELALNLTTNITYQIVSRYNIDTATMTVWVNPAAETDPGATGNDVATAAPISYYGFRQDAAVGAVILVDDLKVGLSFAAVTGTNPVLPSPIPLTAQRVGNQLILSWSNPGFVLQAAPSVTATFTNISGATSPFTNSMAGLPKYFRLKAN
jgi:hypothetical protein